MKVKELNIILQDIKESLNRKYSCSVQPAPQPIMDDIIEEVNKVLSAVFSIDFQEKWYISSAMNTYSEDSDSKKHTASLILFPYRHYAITYFKLKIYIENSTIKKISIPEYKIQTDKTILAVYPELLPFYNLKVTPSYDIAYYFDIIQDTRKIHKKIMTLKNKENLLKCYRNQLTFTKKNIDDFMRFYEENRINECPKLNDVIQELTQIENNENLYTARIVLQWKESNIPQIRAEETFYVPDSKLFSDTIEDKIYLMKRDFFNASHIPACGVAKISTTVSSTFGQISATKRGTEYEQFSY